MQTAPTPRAHDARTTDTIAQPCGIIQTNDVLPIISFARHRFQLRHLLRRHRFLLHGSLDVFGRDEPKRE